MKNFIFIRTPIKTKVAIMHTINLGCELSRAAYVLEGVAAGEASRYAKYKIIYFVTQVYKDYFIKKL
ncbi:MAG TPA: hypothetical protein P5556_09755 [Candidatus Gastranaerophilales bacterium]|nr:hypothetical protein [Candidatus Gastranaerophilales bacterium]